MLMPALLTSTGLFSCLVRMVCPVSNEKSLFRMLRSDYQFVASNGLYKFAKKSLIIHNNLSKWMPIDSRTLSELYHLNYSRPIKCTVNFKEISFYSFYTKEQYQKW